MGLEKTLAFELMTMHTLSLSLPFQKSPKSLTETVSLSLLRNNTYLSYMFDASTCSGVIKVSLEVPVNKVY